VGRNNVPYDISDQVLKKLGTEYDEDIDGYKIDEDILVSIAKKAEDWINDPRLETQKAKKDFLDRKLTIIRLKNQKYKLSTVVGVTVVYDEYAGQWYLFQEGLLDLYIDYCAGHHLDLEKRYLGRNADGSFPSAMKKVQFGKKQGIMKVPALTWLIYDQLRMLYVTLRGEYLGCDETHCTWLKLGGGAQGNSKKYFKKLLGMLGSFESVIQTLQTDGDLEELEGKLKKCKKINLEDCGPLPFMTDLFSAFEFDLLKPKGIHNASLKKTKKGKTKTTRRARGPKKMRKERTFRKSAKPSKRRQSSTIKDTKRTTMKPMKLLKVPATNRMLQDMNLMDQGLN